MLSLPVSTTEGEDRVHALQFVYDPHQLFPVPTCIPNPCPRPRCLSPLRIVNIGEGVEVGRAQRSNVSLDIRVFTLGDEVTCSGAEGRGHGWLGCIVGTRACIVVLITVFKIPQHFEGKVRGALA